MTAIAETLIFLAILAGLFAGVCGMWCALALEPRNVRLAVIYGIGTLLLLAGYVGVVFR